MRRNWLVRLATLLAIAGLIAGVRAGALWDPHEVTVAELARRIGVNLLGGSSLAVAGADNSVPIRADLGRGELPFTSAALGFRLFGLSDWAGRLPLALWSLVGLASLHAALSRLWDRRVALYATLVLATTPLYFLHARVLLGDAVTLAAGAMAWSGFAVACLAEVSPRVRAGFAALGTVGLYAGFWCRGPIVSVAVPALAVGVAALLGRPPSRFARWLALGVSVVGALALALGVSGLALAQQTGDYSVFVGSALARSPELLTFDAVLGNLAHAAFPWSATAPLALALVLKRDDDGSPRRAAVNAAALGLGFSLAASAWLSSSLGGLVPPAVGCFAALVAVALMELETGKLGSPLLGLVVAALGVVIGLDLREYPDKALVGLGLSGVTLPESLRPASASLWLASAAVIALTSVACLYEGEARVGSDQRTPAFQRTEYVRVLATLQRLWDGNLVFALLVLEAALVGFLLLSAVSERLVPLPQLDGFGSLTRKLVACAAIGVPLLPLVPLGALLLRDLTRALFGEHSLGRWRALAPSRAQGLLLMFAALGGVASLGFYPALARQLSPQEALRRYRQLRRPGELLGVLGESRESARYQGAPDALSFEGVDSAFAWLASGADKRRRWLLIRQAELAELNAQFRSLTRQNLPVLDAHSSELLLASNRRLPSERDENPLANGVRSDVPAVQHALHAVLGEQLEVLGWSVADGDGRLATSVVPATTYRFAIYYRVLAPLSGSWQTFVHLDGLQRRFNADHEPLDGKYPPRLWRQNDVIVDTTNILLEPNFSPGAYRVYFGLFSGDRRLPVTEGPQNDDRIVAGTLQVR